MNANRGATSNRYCERTEEGKGFGQDFFHSLTEIIAPTKGNPANKKGQKKKEEERRKKKEERRKKKGEKIIK
jgi:hypothetical protein